MAMTEFQRYLMRKLRMGHWISIDVGGYYWQHKKLLEPTVDALLATDELEEITVKGKYFTNWRLVHKNPDRDPSQKVL